MTNKIEVNKAKEHTFFCKTYMLSVLYVIIASVKKQLHRTFYQKNARRHLVLNSDQRWNSIYFLSGSFHHLWCESAYRLLVPGAAVFCTL